MSLAARLRAYHPDGDHAGFLAEPTSWSASLPVNDASAMRLAYPAAARNADLLTGALEVAVEINDGTGWTEPRNARYRRVEQGGNRAQGGADVPSYTMPGYASLLEGVRVIPASYGNPTNYDTDGKRKFLSASVGQILATVLQEARGLVSNLVPGLSLAFTPSQDADGAEWSRRVTIYYEPGISLLTILDNLAMQGQCDWWMQGRTLHVVNPDSTSTHTDIRILSPASEEPVRSSLAGLLHTAFLVGDEQTWRVDNAGTPTPWGTSMKVLTQGGVRDEGTATQLIQAELHAGSRERVEYTRTVPLAGSDAKDLPLVAYGLGDFVHARNKAGAWEEMRVHQVTLSFDGTLSAALTLNDRFIDAEVRNAKRMRGIVNGASGDAGTGGVPERPRNARPIAPEGLVTDSQGYWQDGLAKSSVQASWGPVQVDTNGYAINISHYLLRIHGRTIRTDLTTGGVDDLTPEIVVAVEVAAVSWDGVQGDWASTTQATLPPLERLDPPTTFTVSAEYGIVTIEWDGQLQGDGQPYDPPLHFAGVKVEESESPGGPYALVAEIRGGAAVLDRQDILGETRWYRGIAVDVLGDGSEPGPATSVVVRSIISEEIEQAKQDSQDAIDRATDALTAAGEAITSSVVQYAVGSSETNPPASGWSTATPTRTPGSFIWMRTVITYGDESTVTTSPALVTGNRGAPGDKGEDGTSVTIAGSVPTAAQLPDDLGTDDAGEGWITSDDGHLHVWSGTAWADVGEIRGPQGEPGDDGADGRSVLGVDVLYYLSTSPTALTGGSWVTHAPTVPEGRWLWSKTVVVYSSGEPTESTPAMISGHKGEPGTDGSPGRGITSIVEQYYLSTSDTSLTGGSWVTTPPAPVAGRYFWTRSVITYTAGSPPTATTDPVMVSGHRGEDGISVTAITTYYTLWDTENAPAPPAPTTNPPPSPWSTTEPDYTPGLDLYRVELVTYSDDTWVYTPVQKSSSYAAAVYVGNLAEAATQGLVVASPTAPPHYAGRLWLRLDMTGELIGILRSNGTTWQSYALMANEILVPGSVGNVVITNGAVDAEKITASQAMFDKIVTNEFAAGKITAQMFSTSAAFSGPGVHIDRTGVEISGLGNRNIWLNATDGLRVRNAAGATSFQATIDGSVSMSGALLAGGTITGPVFQTTATANRGLKIDNAGMRGYSNTGVQTLNYTSTTGTVEITGDFQLRANDFPNVEIRRNTWADFTGLRWNYTSGQGANVPEIKVNHTTWNSWWAGSIFLTGPNRGTGRPELIMGRHDTFGSNIYLNVSDGTGTIVSELRVSPGAHRFTNSTGTYQLNSMLAGAGSFDVTMDTNWVLRYAGSLRALKTDIAALTPDDPYDVLRLTPVTYRAMEEVALHGDAAEHEFGLIAEDVADVAGEHTWLTPLLQHREGELRGVAYARLSVLMLPLLADLARRIDTLEGTT